MACPICGEQCTCPREREVSTRAALLDPEPRGDDPPLSDGQDDVWRQEVASRVDAFCARRGRKRMPRIPSLSLDFERAARATAAAHYAVPEPQVEPAPEPAPEPEASNLIEFPRPAEPPSYLEPIPTIEELAEPILEKPRILDAEEPSGLLFGGEGRPAITLESPPEPQPDDDAGPVGEHASLSRRIFAATLDGLLVAIAAAVFATIFLHIAGTLPRSRTAFLLALAVPVFLWAMYQYLFLVHAAATPGMRVAGLCVRTFDNLPARRSLRRWRAITMMVSGMALGLGFLWASIDEYGLCWHDRITRTVLRRG
ncbi:MAG: RDD family protein [Terriglobales bacterium]